MNCQEVREEMAVALMTHSRVDADVLAHLSRCPACSTEAGQMHEVVDLLGDLRPTGARPNAQDEIFLERLLREAGQRRGAARLRLAVASAVAAAVVLLVLGATVARFQSFGGAQDLTASARQAGVAASVVIEEDDGASDLVVSISGVATGTHCILRVSSTVGGDEVVADWIALYDGTSHVEADADAPPQALSLLQVIDATSDRALVLIPLT
jgi:hypothetical protein